ncbi:ComEA family DNA-binding protein [Levilactobacillus suantsaiihabitans]|uniref:ComEA family DNA-binding protein n=1 Tax=Levilactobacillus suantsaiihabitans TaxID=2487722 RepID=A0A4Z0J871_9LACO|nr:ComEA family DNA-binding protein [Levilactobacillus suantsaiihabitans]TGD17839.1 ComEA family DNA-binding protein [Levilactobacillus suantsaiihabitans]
MGQKIQEWWLTLPRKQQVLGLVGVLGVLVIGGWLLLRQPAPAALPAAIPPATTSSSGQSHATGAQTQATATSQASSHDTRVFVDVQGAVRHPGLYQFTAEMRVADAIKAAGGLVDRADRQQINLATRLTDQQQLYLPLKGEKRPAAAASGNATVGSSATGSGSAASSGSGSATVVNLNTATVTDLQQLTGVGAKKAQKIVDYRTEHGSFQTVADLAQVPGFGEKTVANLQDQLTT